MSSNASSSNGHSLSRDRCKHKHFVLGSSGTGSVPDIHFNDDYQPLNEHGAIGFPSGACEVRVFSDSGVQLPSAAKGAQ